MATDTPENVPSMPSDAELFQQSTAPEPASPEAVPAPAGTEPQTAAQQAEALQQARDEQGRFTAERVAAPEPPPPPAAPQPDEGIPPPHRWKEMREELEAERRSRREMEFALYDMNQRMRAQQEQMAKAQPQTPPKVPDPIIDPQGYQQHVERNFSERLRSMEQNFSFRIAHDRNGEAFEQAYGSMLQMAERGDPSVVRAVMSSPDPGQAMMNWYRQATNLAKLGNNDPETWAEKQWLAEKLKDQKFQGQLLDMIRGTAQQNGAATAGGGSPNVQLPPSLNRMAAAAPVSASNGDMSDQSLFDVAFRQGRSSR